MNPTEEQLRAFFLVVAQSGLASVVALAVMLQVVNADRTVKRLCSMGAAFHAVIWILTLQSITRFIPTMAASGVFVLLLAIEAWFFGVSIVNTERAKIEAAHQKRRKDDQMVYDEGAI